MSRLLLLLIAFLLVVIMSGCASVTKTEKNWSASKSASLETIVNRTHFNGKTVTAAVFTMRQVDPVSGKDAQWVRSGHLLESDSILDRALLAVIGGTGAAAIQGHFFKEAMAAKACRGLNCGLLNISNPVSHAGAISESVSEMSNTIGAGNPILWAE